MERKHILKTLVLVLCTMVTSVSAYAQKYYQMTWREFYALPETQKPIDPKNPDYELIDAAFFHATNEAREKEKRKTFLYSEVLYTAANEHSTSMISKNYYAHEDRTDKKRYLPGQRITLAGGKFMATAENIAQYEVIATPGQYCPRKQSNGEYRYFDCNTDKVYPAHTAVSFAQKVVKGWMNSPGHRRNILNTDYQYMACAIQIIKNPYKSENTPFARITQNFGGGLMPSSQASTR
ncbi:CAP domain-containing protein [Cytophagaceae bacterium DM2B3-1]|uniref:CAP domain-containing protein n=1 Tax=Xanthocytophaga flava TaxID=3048013 RepID=A0ABT7CUX0_9BACT|nr:CAP domain-containing protein [Xanthocytophaga flavus]MDJ1497566.1 CAP domain-containing protein [Xanthocytophaga flavus]